MHYHNQDPIMLYNQDPITENVGFTSYPYPILAGEDAVLPPIVALPSTGEETWCTERRHGKQSVRGEHLEKVVERYHLLAFGEDSSFLGRNLKERNDSFVRFFSNQGHYYFQGKMGRLTSEGILKDRRREEGTAASAIGEDYRAFTREILCDRGAGAAASTFDIMVAYDSSGRKPENRTHVFFLVRLSSTVPGTFVISHEKPTGGFTHFLIRSGYVQGQLKFYHNLNYNVYTYNNLTELLDRYFSILGVSATGIKSPHFAAFQSLVESPMLAAPMNATFPSCADPTQPIISLSSSCTNGLTVGC
eukprot:CAMPEP_0174278070 /NCGR_PEP_ID=MMETSP0439-20130205/61273_1 /TAXON_ID=0 /ORGANISM="Stereomyxa ramosa, Strain Chinc5" /LENGTH=303 /DNA_ID=CAMNT_0015370441 /DNA_START=127 /DNA_END=1038 /DNA_ORIENTATION=+